ncbi:MAG: ATP-binding protein [Phycisphaerae bacterium]
MSSAALSPDAAVQEREIARLLDIAVSEGERDIYSGKRRWVRYHLGARLEVQVLGSGANGRRTTTAVMHNISGGGLGFWTRDLLSEHTRIRIRELGDDGPSSWVSARVTHASLGIRGYLVGAAFLRPIDDDDEHESPAGEPAIPAVSHEREGPPPATAAPRARRSLRSASTLAATIGSAVGAALGLTVAQFAPATLTWHAPAAIAVVVAALVGACSAWLGFMPVKRALRQLHDEIVRTTPRDSHGATPTKPPFAELAGPLLALQQLRARWRSHEHDERVQRQKLEEISLIKGNILSTVSHDLRTPLTSILLYTEMLAEGLEIMQPADQRRFLDVIRSECERLSRLVDDLLEAQRLESGRARWKFESLDPARLVHGCAMVFEPMALSRCITLKVDCPEALPAIEADADKLSQVLSNLVSNAIKYTPERGQVIVSAKATGAEVLFCVSDNGPGIPREKWDYIFERFAQVTASFVREIGGVGLGLYIVRQIVEHHGGRVWLESEVGQGSTFYVALPMRKNEPDRAPHAPDANAGRVLVCDADPALSARVAQALRRSRFDVRCVHSGSRLLAAVVEYGPGVVVTDLMLPDTDAADLLRALVALKQRHAFRLVAHTYVGDGASLRADGVDVILTRPAQLEELLQAVRIGLRRNVVESQIVAVASSSAADARVLVGALSSAGHTVFVAESPARLARVAADYPLDVCIALGERAVEALGSVRRAFPAAKLVLVGAPVARERSRVEELGAAVVRMTDAWEDEVLAALADARRALTGASA